MSGSPSSFEAHAEARDAVRVQIEKCWKCQLGGSNRVPFDGPSWNPKLIIVGEAPGADENLARKPFVGRAGQLLNALIQDTGITRDHCFVINTVCCRPPKNRNPEWVEVKACAPNFEAQIKLANTWVGVVLGKVALEATKGEVGDTIGANINKPFWAHQKIWIPTYHPAYALRQPGAKVVIRNSIAIALRYLKGELEPPEPRQNGWFIERGHLILNNSSTPIPKWATPDALAQAGKLMFELTEWVKIRYLPDRDLAAIVESKKQLGASIVS